VTTILLCKHEKWPMGCEECRAVNWGTVETETTEAFRLGVEYGKNKAAEVVYQMMGGSPDARNIEAAIKRIKAP
jgi:hypothetical protein